MTAVMLEWRGACWSMSMPVQVMGVDWPARTETEVLRGRGGVTMCWTLMVMTPVVD